MKVFLFNLFLILSTLQISAQQLTKDVFLGSWKVVDSQLIPEMKLGLDEDGQKKMEQLRTGLVGTVFNFKDTGEFNIKYSDNIPSFMKELEFVNNKKWKIEDTSTIAIGTTEDNYSLMSIIFVSKLNKKYFILEETPFILEIVEQ